MRIVASNSANLVLSGMEIKKCKSHNFLALLERTMDALQSLYFLFFFFTNVYQRSAMSIQKDNLSSKKKKLFVTEFCLAFSPVLVSLTSLSSIDVKYIASFIILSGWFFNVQQSPILLLTHLYIKFNEFNELHISHWSQLSRSLVRLIQTLNMSRESCHDIKINMKAYKYVSEIMSMRSIKQSSIPPKHIRMSTNNT